MSVYCFCMGLFSPVDGSSGLFRLGPTTYSKAYPTYVHRKNNLQCVHLQIIQMQKSSNCMNWDVGMRKIMEPRSPGQYYQGY